MQSYYESVRDNMRMPLTWYDRRNCCPPHFHAGIELVYVLEGSFEAAINGRGMTVRAGELLVTNCYSVHAYSAESCLSITSVIPLGVVPSVRKVLTANRFRENIITDDERRSIEFLMRLLADNPGNEIMQKGLCYSLIGLLTERIPLDPIGASDQASVICAILNYLNENFERRLTVEQVAAQFGYSRSRFSHLFKNTVGYSLPQYLNMLRCRSVCEAMLSSDASVADLAANAGFNSTQSFYAAFKAVYGMTPREYIRRHYAGGEKK